MAGSAGWCLLPINTCVINTCVCWMAMNPCMYACMQLTVTPFSITYIANDTARNSAASTRLVHVYDECPLPEYTCP